MQDEKFVEDDAPLSHRLTRAIKHAIFGGGKDVNLPLEDEEGNPRKRTPEEDVKASEMRQTEVMQKFKDFGRKVSDNPAVQEEIKKARKRAGMSEEDATLKALGRER